MNTPTIIQGGMGIGISGWRLAKSVSQLGHLGVVSGTAIESVFIRKLQDGDPEDNLLRAIEAFPFQDVAQRILEKYYRKDPRRPEDAYKTHALISASLPKDLQDLIVLANFVEIYLAKEGHQGSIGLNLLEKIQLITLPSLYGAILAGVDVITMGAGIPREIPGALESLSINESTSLNLNVVGASSGDNFQTHFNPTDYAVENLNPLKKPLFYAIISSHVLAATLKKKANGPIDGFIIETPFAGGHNAPPRGKMIIDEQGEPQYGDRDKVDIEAVEKLGIPFWLAGAYGSAEGLKYAKDQGAQGIQLGTAFALCEESGLSPHLKATLLEQITSDSTKIFTDPKASPTGFPFKVAEISETYSDDQVNALRPRRCDLGYLRELYKKPDGTIGYRCPGEPKESYLKKGGPEEATEGKKCLCNALLANLDLAQTHPNGFQERPLVTLGDDVINLKRFISPEKMHYSAKDVILDLQKSS